jgi:hypothetical protein
LFFSFCLWITGLEKKAAVGFHNPNYVLGFLDCLMTAVFHSLAGIDNQVKEHGLKVIEDIKKKN